MSRQALDELKQQLPLLDYLQAQDWQPARQITLITLDGTYVYRVVSFRVVNPTEVSVLSSSPDEKILTLVTCYPFYFVGNAPKRFVVRTVQVTGIPSSHQT